MDKRTVVLGKPVVSRTETVQAYVDKVGHKNAVIGISAYYGILAYIIRLVRIRSKFIYYCIDYYIPSMARGRLDSVFVWLHIRVDRFLAEHADEVWDISQRINEGRWAHNHITTDSTIVPLA